jgi:seryl-tRNA synthetase
MARNTQLAKAALERALDNVADADRTGEAMHRLRSLTAALDQVQAARRALQHEIRDALAPRQET